MPLMMLKSVQQICMTGTITAPFELRNDFARLTVDGLANAGGAYLLDDGFRRRRVGCDAVQWGRGHCGVVS